MKNSIVTFFCIIFYSSVCNGQKQFGVKVTTGISSIILRYEDGHYPGGDSFRQLPGISGTAGFYYNWLFSERSALGIELLFNHIQDAETYTDWNYLANGDLPLVVDRINKSDYNYLSVPAYYGLKLKNVQINLGVQASWLLSGSVLLKSETSNASSKKRFKIKNIDEHWEYGARLGLFIKLSKRMSLEWNYYHGLTDLTRDHSYITSRKTIIQTTVGLRYLIRDFLKSEMSNKE